MIAQDLALSVAVEEVAGADDRPALSFANSGTTAARVSPFAVLSARECEIAALVASGKSNKEIARVLLISPCTVSSHLRQIFAKLGLTRRIELCLLWHRAKSLDEV